MRALCSVASIVGSGHFGSSRFWKLNSMHGSCMVSSAVARLCAHRWCTPHKRWGQIIVGTLQHMVHGKQSQEVRDVNAIGHWMTPQLRGDASGIFG